jgi:hypothetical protein
VINYTYPKNLTHKCFVSERLRAVHLAVPSIMAKFKTVYKDQEGQVVDARSYSIDLNSGNDLIRHHLDISQNMLRLHH